jgi:hypothetical protein
VATGRWAAKILGVGRLIQLFFPTENACAGSVVFGLFLVSAFHPDTGQAGVHVDILVESEGFLRCLEGVIEVATIKVDFGHGVPSRRVIGGQSEGFGDQSEGFLVFPESEFKNSVIDEVLRGRVWHMKSLLKAEGKKREARGRKRIDRVPL